jgi:hypothetical protein
MITARVSDVLPNGDLVVEGVREIEINGDRQIVVLTGVVRPWDINPTNVVLSTVDRATAHPLLWPRPHSGQPEARLADSHSQQGVLMTTQRLALALGVLMLLGSVVEAQTAPGIRLKDVARLQGVASTPAIGYGLVVGLNKDRR